MRPLIGRRFRCRAIGELHFVSPEDKEETLTALPAGFVKGTIVRIENIMDTPAGPIYDLYVESLGRRQLMDSWAFTPWFEEIP